MKIQSYKLQNHHGISVEFLNYGCIVTKIMTPDSKGEVKNIVLGHENPEDYLKANPSYFGAIIGRYANRISAGRIKIGDQAYDLYKNDGSNSLHGGLKGFDKVFWDAQEMVPNRSYRLTYRSPHLDEGYPGNLDVAVTYSLNDENEFSIDYEAVSDQATHINLTSHCYFNLSGDRNKTIFDHNLFIAADFMTESNEEYLPTGKIIPVNGEFDFRTLHRVGERLPMGFNENYILNDVKIKAKLHDPDSRRCLECETTEPALQFYSGAYLEKASTGLCLEAQHYPDSPSHSHFPSTLLLPETTYRQRTIYRFGTL